MSKRKNKLIIFGLERNPFNDIQFDALCTQGFNLHVVYTVNQRNTKNNTQWDSFSDNKYTWNYSTGLGRLALLLYVIRNRNDTIIFTGYSSIYFVMSMCLCLILNVRYLVFTDTPVIKKRAGLVKAILKRIVIWLSFHASSGVLTTGNPGRKVLLDLGCCDKKIINFPYTPSALHFFQIESSDTVEISSLRSKVGEKPVIFYSSQLIYRKGLDVLICALDILMRRDIQFYAIIEGEGPLRNYYGELVAKFGMEHTVEFVGFNQSSVHASLLQFSDIVVSPSRWEPWGNIVPEAMEFGKLVIASDAVESANDRIKHKENGLIFSSDNVGELVDCLLVALTEAEVRREISEKATITSQSWGPEINAIFLRSFLED